MPPDAHARLHLYFGPDDFSMRDAYRTLRAALDEDGMLDTNTTVLPARGLKPQELIQHAATVPFLAQARMVVVEGLVGALGGGKGVAETWQPLLDALPTLPETSHIVLLEPVTPGNRGREQSTRLARSALMKALRAVEGVDAQEFRELTIFGRNGQESPLARWAHERAEERGIAIERPAVAELVDLVGANLWALASELEKLSRYAADRAVTVEDVRLLTPQAREESIFAIVDAVVEGRAAPALKLIRAMLDEGPERPPQNPGDDRAPAPQPRARHRAAGRGGAAAGGRRGHRRAQQLRARQAHAAGGRHHPRDGRGVPARRRSLRPRGEDRAHGRHAGAGPARDAAGHARPPPGCGRRPLTAATSRDPSGGSMASGSVRAARRSGTGRAAGGA